MFRREGRDRDVCIFVDHAWLDFVSVDSPAIRDGALVSLRIHASVDVNAIGLKDVLGHRAQPSGPVYLERSVPARRPSGKNQIRIASCVIGMEVRHKRHLQIGELKYRNAPLEKSGFGATHDTETEIDQINV